MASSFCTGAEVSTRSGSAGVVDVKDAASQQFSVPSRCGFHEAAGGSAGLIHLMKTASSTGKPLDALRSVHDRMGQAERALAIARELDATFLIHPMKTEDLFMDDGDYPR